MYITADQYYYIYSAMAQSTGALIALVGIFIVFRLQHQSDRIRRGREKIERIIYARPLLPLKELINDAEKYINETKPGQSTIDDRDRREIAIEQLFNLKWHINSFHHTIKYGFVGIGFTAGLFMMFITLLYLHKLWRTQKVFFNVSFTISILVIGYLVWFIYVVLKKW